MTSLTFDESIRILEEAPLTKDTLQDTIQMLGFNHPTHFGNFATGGLELQQIPKELADLTRYLIANCKTPIIRYLEVGLGSCATMIFLQKALEKNGIQMQLFGADNLLYQDSAGLDQRGRINWIRANLGADVFIGDTAEQGFPDFLNGKEFDVIFIDAEHTYAACAREFSICSPHLSEAGVIIFHDMASAQCPQVVDVFKNIEPYFNKTSKFVSSDKCGIGLLEGLKAPVTASDYFSLMRRQAVTTENDELTHMRLLVNDKTQQIANLHSRIADLRLRNEFMQDPFPIPYEIIPLL